MHQRSAVITESKLSDKPSVQNSPVQQYT